MSKKKKGPTLAPVATKPAKAAKDTTPKTEAPTAKRGEPKAPKKARRSGLNAAATVLAAAGKPMTVKDIVDAATTQKLWASEGKTPYATVYAAIIREIAAKGLASRFRKTAPGQFEFVKPS